MDSKSFNELNSSVVISDILIPGLGQCLLGRCIKGLLFELLYVAGIAFSFLLTAHWHFHPVRSFIFFIGFYIVLQGLLLFSTDHGDTSAVFRNYIIGLLFFCISIFVTFKYGIFRYYSIFVVTDTCEYPLTIPGDIVLYKHYNKAYGDSHPLLVYRTENGVSMARLIASTGHIIQISWPYITVDGAKWPQKPVGLASPYGANQDYPPFIAIREFPYNSVNSHLVFYDADVYKAPVTDLSSPSHILLCDNRACIKCSDSSSQIIPDKNILGRPIMVLFSISQGRINFTRSGILFNKVIKRNSSLPH